MPDLSLTPRFSLAEARELVRALWGVEGELVALPSERDQNFRVTPAAGSGPTMVVKFTSAEEDATLLAAQHAALARLAPLGLCPRVIPTLDGRELVAVPSTTPGEPGLEHLVRAVDYLPGIPLASLAPDPEDPSGEAVLERLGARLGQVDEALLGLDAPALDRPFDWGLSSAEAVVEAHLPLVEASDPLVHAGIAELLARFRAQTKPRLAGCRRSVIHGDAHGHNVLADPETRAIVGLIDFGDLNVAWTVGELAIAGAYALLDQPEPLDAFAALARGYASALPLRAAEIDAAWGLACLRLCVSVCMAAKARQQRPDDPYLDSSQAAIRRTLPRLLERPFALAREVVHAACTSPAPRSRSGGAPRPARAQSTPALLERRRQHTLANTRLAYREPIHLRRGWMQHLYAADGRRYLDAYNNVPHVGHSHPRVVAAAVEQQRKLATNSRYLYEALPEYAERLAATLPAPLEVCALLNSASEANELALRLARAATGSRELIVLDHAYHGHTTSLIDASPYKHAGPGGRGAPAWVHVASLPDRVRGAGAGRPDSELAAVHAADVDRQIAAITSAGGRVGAFLAETCPSVGGQHLLPEGYLPAVYAAIRAASGVVIADEVQTGFGRLGSSFYAFEDHGVVPDIVVLGKPIGNGFPLAAVVTTPAIAAAFDDGMEFFSTFGGNPVACEVGLAVLDVLADEQRQAHAAHVGERLLAGLAELDREHPTIADVRGRGLFLGVELVTDPDTLEPDAALATRVVERLRADGILIGTDGPAHNVLKIRPPMCFDLDDADRLLAALARALAAG